MDFFARQDSARRRTSLLVFLYIVAVVLVIAAVYFAFALAFIGIAAGRSRTGGADWEKLWDPEVFAWVAGVTLGVVVIGTLCKMVQLRHGGRAVAEILGGRPVLRSTRDPAERRLLKVVEEIAIASGTSVPPVFVLDSEKGINAFAAGFTPSDAVIGVTRGCVEKLSRDELQGVIAHEFSHILNGDMRLNLRLIGVLNGILVLALTGYVVLRITPHMLRGMGRGSRGKGGAAALGIVLALLIFGVLLLVIGYVGVFVGKIIKSAVSRQREFLADAAAVEFTRQPSGLAGALKKIGGGSYGSRIRSPRAEEASHIFFANGLWGSISGLTATHPPTLERVRRLEPGFDGDFSKYVAAHTKPASAPARAKPAKPFPGPLSVEGGVMVGTVLAAQALRYRADPDEVAASVGSPAPEHLDYASRLIASLPKKLVRGTEDPFGARAVVYCLLLNTEAGPRRRQLERLEQHAGEPVYRETLRFVPEAERIDPQARLPLLDMAIPTLGELSADHYRAFIDNVDHLIRADERVDVFEYVASRTIMRRLAPIFGKAKPPVARYYAIKPLVGTCVDLLACLAYRGAADAADAQQAFARGVVRVGMRRMPAMPPAESCGLRKLDDALGKLALASPAIKKRVIEACTACVAADGVVTVDEAELLRAVAVLLDCPVPPFLPGQRVQARPASADARGGSAR
jgi:Zn-dependent protease with chaperone function